MDILERRKNPLASFEYRPRNWDIKNNILVLGHESGRVTFIEFNPNLMY